MTQKELLDILYAERNRLLSIYSRPGWTNWALVAAIATLFWMLLDIIPQCSNLTTFNVGAYTFLILNSFATIGIFREAFKNNHSPKWDKTGISGITNTIYLLFVYIVQLILLLQNSSFFTIKFTYYFTIVLSICVILSAIVSFIYSFKLALITQKLNLPMGIVNAIFTLIFVFTWGECILHNSFYDWNVIKVGILSAAILILCWFFDFDLPTKLNGIDKLINKVLYSQNSNENDVLTELEEYTIGLRYGNYLVNTYLERIYNKTQQLYDNLLTLREDLDSVSSMTKSFKDLIDWSTEISKGLNQDNNHVVHMINLGYTKEDIDVRVTPLLSIINQSNQLIKIWLDISTQMDKLTFSEFKDFINLKYSEANILLNAKSN